MKILLVVAIAVCLESYVFGITTEWKEFKETFSKQYTNETEETYRKEIFRKNLQYINTHNEKYNNGLETFYLKVNHFADLLPEEIPNGYVQSKELLNQTYEEFIPNPKFILPKHVDWREKGAVTRVKDQLNCGSCWAFSAVGAMEGAHAIKHKKLVELSEQNLVDCSRYLGNKGCSGGLMELAFIYVNLNGGIDKEWFYPYLGFESICRYSSLFSGMKVKTYKTIKPQSELHLMHAVAELGPVSVAIAASGLDFVLYGGGLFFSPFCWWPAPIDHGVLVVGYGETHFTKTKYWIVKNSWGSGWGESGYIRMARGVDMCQITSQPVIPIAQ